MAVGYQIVGEAAVQASSINAATGLLLHLQCDGDGVVDVYIRLVQLTCWEEQPVAVW